jgi:hypothetical protein
VSTLHCKKGQFASSKAEGIVEVVEAEHWMFVVFGVGDTARVVMM